jgi:rSAM/selenodomain-associated transferase 2
MDESISAIVPTLNEAALIGGLIRRLGALRPEPEIVVVDGGSEDDTVALASGAALVVRAPRGRAAQMNAGARAASGGVLWFLHADCLPSERSTRLILECLSDPEVVGGGFRWGLDGSRWYYPAVTAAAHAKNKLRGSLFGDMGIFVRRDAFEELGGYAEIPIFEEVELNRRLKRLGRTVILDEVLPSSDRRLRERGPVRSFIENDVLKVAYALGLSPERLRRFY